ncbi:hypothetical protein EHQ24_07440 [Leptospira noumeaensis]|uniref:Uncharacterized protein n=1 Tax=Leptospira noumeaensis TaxID=2484964 RepID=A0A4R9I9U9_9LEPT|nr:hypothetical protein [Leptospira noumeaensis]TGK83137.1 hypothetical protein EHQ24_07440 [Leptospira noumeaensis]
MDVKIKNMKTILPLLTLISSLFLFSNCIDEERESRKRGQNLFIGSLAMAGFFRPNYCSAPEILLEEGKVYNITLEPRKKFWFDYAIRSKGGNKKYRLTVNKDANTIVQYQLKACDLSNDQGERLIISSNSTQIVYENESFSYTDPSEQHQLVI